MANQTIPNLPATTALIGTEQLWAVQNGTDVRITIQQIATLLNASNIAFLLNLPTTLPANSGVLWNNGGVICIS